MTSYRVVIDGSDVSFACAADDALLRAGLRQGVGLAYECNVGSCGSCKYELLEGEVRELCADPPGLRPADRKRGRRLACQSVALGDVRIRMVTGEQYRPVHPPQRRRAVLTERRQITHDISEFRFVAVGAADFLAGQYALLGIDGIELPRAYSMSNTANAHGGWNFMVRRVPSGRASTALFDRLSPGDSVTLDGPYGLAHYRATPRETVCVAGGSGVAPMASILRSTGRGHLFYGGRTELDIPTLAHLFDGDGATDGITFRPVVGFVHEQLPDALTRPLPDYEFYLAGPPPMIEAAVRLLAIDHAVPQGQIHYDRFF